jgi:hypothetical protein
LKSTSIAARLQASYESLYGIEAPNVESFVVPIEDGREALLVRKARGALELSVRLPKEALETTAALSFDVACQIAEGISHFLYVVERARRRIPTTQLELEIQAEVDKFVLLSGLMATRPGRSSDRIRDVRRRLFDQPVFLHAEDTEPGERYRVANDVANRFVGALEREAERGREHLHRRLRSFHSSAQREKFEMSLAA